ncbi:hypothetical protein F5X96DRAFT_67045 [Biscogniauxia mediterranea]|nr:hypothetical protein F5X96DRAFT_67045 [Biscogniauxia mediterranea]
MRRRRSRRITTRKQGFAIVMVMGWACVHACISHENGAIYACVHAWAHETALKLCVCKRRNKPTDRLVCFASGVDLTYLPT